MTARHLRILGILLLGSCSGSEKDGDQAEDAPVDVDAADADTDADADADTEPSGDTGAEVPLFEPVAMTVLASFAWDQEGQTLVEATADGEPLPNQILLIFGDEDWAESGGTGGDACAVGLPLGSANPVNPEWVTSDPELFFGFDYRSEDGAVTSCVAETGHPLDPAIWGDPQSFMEFWMGRGWGVAIGALRTTSTQHASNASTQTGIPLENWTGAAINNTVLAPPNGTIHFVAVAEALDSGFAIAGGFVSASGIQVPSGGIATGYYSISPEFLFPLQ